MTSRRPFWYRLPHSLKLNDLERFARFWKTKSLKSPNKHNLQIHSSLAPLSLHFLPSFLPTSAYLLPPRFRFSLFLSDLAAPPLLASPPSSTRLGSSGLHSMADTVPATPRWNLDRPFLTGRFHQVSSCSGNFTIMMYDTAP